MSQVRNHSWQSTLPEPVGCSAESNFHDSTRVANYIVSMSRGLSSMAGQAGLQTLSYLLDMARLEAESIAQTVELKSDAQYQQR